MISSLLENLSPELISGLTQKFGLDQTKALEVVSTTKNSLIESLTKEATGGNFDGILGMLNQGSGLIQNPMFKSILGNLTGSYASKLGLSPEMAMSIASFVLPKIISAISSSKSGRKEIAASSGIDEKIILDWVNMADLFRVKGVASQFAELPKATGVDTVKEFRTRNAEHLHQALVSTNEAKNLTNAMPALSKVTDFIE